MPAILSRLLSCINAVYHFCLYRKMIYKKIK